jgi:hypothetical protein
MMEQREADEYMEMVDDRDPSDYYFPHVEMVELDDGVPVNGNMGSNRMSSLGMGLGRSYTRPPRNRNSPANKPVKMYELDPNIYPEAAAARASYENRIRKKQEKARMMNEMTNLRQRNKELEDENKLLKEQLENMRTDSTGSKLILKL